MRYLAAVPTDQTPNAALAIVALIVGTYWVTRYVIPALLNRSDRKADQ